MKVKTGLLLAGLMLLSGCTAQAWYEGFRQGRAAPGCDSNSDLNDPNRCLNQLPNYQNYQQQRDELNKKP